MGDEKMVFVKNNETNNFLLFSKMSHHNCLLDFMFLKYDKLNIEKYSDRLIKCTTFDVIFVCLFTSVWKRIIKAWLKIFQFSTSYRTFFRILFITAQKLKCDEIYPQ